MTFAASREAAAFRPRRICKPAPPAASSPAAPGLPRHWPPTPSRERRRASRCPRPRVRAACPEGRSRAAAVSLLPNSPRYAIYFVLSRTSKALVRRMLTVSLFFLYRYSQAVASFSPPVARQRGQATRRRVEPRRRRCSLGAAMRRTTRSPLWPREQTRAR